MGADMHMHVLEGIEESELEGMFYNCVGSKYCPITRFDDNTTDDEAKRIFADMDRLDKKYGRKKHGDNGISERVARTPQVWIGEVSWLKAGLLENPDRYIPQPVQLVADIVGEDLPVIDDQMILQIKNALESDNITGYSTAHVKKVVDFLEAHKGKKVFTVSW
jgi:hypothetical protein